MKPTQLFKIEPYVAGALGGLGGGILIQQGLSHFVFNESPEDVIAIIAGFSVFSSAIWLRSIYDRTIRATK